MPITKIEHQLGPTWAQHLARMRQEMAAHEAKAMEFDGRAAAQRLELDTKRRHASQLLALIAESEKLPQPVRPYELSQDGTKIVGEVETDAPAA